jgi:hypothetical protein
MSEINKLHYSRPSGYHQNSIFSDKQSHFDDGALRLKAISEIFGKMNRRERREMERNMAKLRLNNKK